LNGYFIKMEASDASNEENREPKVKSREKPKLTLPKPKKRKLYRPNDYMAMEPEIQKQKKPPDIEVENMDRSDDQDLFDIYDVDVDMKEPPPPLEADPELSSSALTPTFRRKTSRVTKELRKDLRNMSENASVKKRKRKQQSSNDVNSLSEDKKTPKKRPRINQISPNILLTSPRPLCHIELSSPEQIETPLIPRICPLGKVKLIMSPAQNQTISPNLLLLRRDFSQPFTLDSPPKKATRVQLQKPLISRNNQFKPIDALERTHIQLSKSILANISKVDKEKDESLNEQMFHPAKSKSSKVFSFIPRCFITIFLISLCIALSLNLLPTIKGSNKELPFCTDNSSAFIDGHDIFDCAPCPDFANCVEGRARCRNEKVLINNNCHDNEEEFLILKEMENYVLIKLAEKRGKFICGEEETGSLETQEIKKLVHLKFENDTLVKSFFPRWASRIHMTHETGYWGSHKEKLMVNSTWRTNHYATVELTKKSYYCTANAVAQWTFLITACATLIFLGILGTS